MLPWWCHNFQVAGLDLPRWIPEAEQMHGCFWVLLTKLAGTGVLHNPLSSAAMHGLASY